MPDVLPCARCLPASRISSHAALSDALQGDGGASSRHPRVQSPGLTCTGCALPHKPSHALPDELPMLPCLTRCKVAEALAAGTYVPSDLGAPGWEIWAGFVAGVVPFAIGSWEFGKRIVSPSC